mgnify:CR=1 FL=1
MRGAPRLQFSETYKQIGIGLCCLLLFACSSTPETEAENPDGGPPGLRLQSDKANSLEIGEEAVVALQIDEGRGYEWQYINSDTAVIELVEIQSDSHDAVGEDDRANSDYYYIWKAKQSGRATLRYRYLQPWQSGDQPLKTYSYEVVVR